VPRSEKKQTKDGKEVWGVEDFEVYGPKAFAGLESLANTLADRTFAIKMQAAETRRPRLKPHKLEPEAAWRRAALAFWAAEAQLVLKGAVNVMPDELPSLMAYDHRFQDIAEPLLIIATIADQERPSGPLIVPRLLEGLNAASRGRRGVGRARQYAVFFRLAEYKLGTASDVFVPSSELLDNCEQTDGLQTIESVKALSNFLRPLGLHPRQASDGRSRGYLLTKHWLEDSRTRCARRSGEA
jgi:hypothetical protein